MRHLKTDSPDFIPSLKFFSEFPKRIPKMSIMIFDELKPITLICFYNDAGAVFIHGLFKSTYSTKKEFLFSLDYVEKYILENMVGKFAVITFTHLKRAKKLFIKNGFQTETIEMLTRAP